MPQAAGLRYLEESGLSVADRPRPHGKLFDYLATGEPILALDASRGRDRPDHPRDRFRMGDRPRQYRHRPRGLAGRLAAVSKWRAPGRRRAARRRKLSPGPPCPVTWPAILASTNRSGSLLAHRSTGGESGGLRVGIPRRGTGAGPEARRPRVFLTACSARPLAANLYPAGIPEATLEKPPGFSPRTVLALARRLKRDRVEVVHGHNPGVHHYAALAGRLAGVPACLNTRHSAATSTGVPYEERYFRWVRPLSGTSSSLNGCTANCTACSKSSITATSYCASTARTWWAACTKSSAPFSEWRSVSTG